MFGDNESYPSVVKDFEHSFEVLEKLPCDIVIATHPAATEFWQQLEVRERGEKDALTDQTACSRYAAAARSRLENGLIMKKIPRSDLFCVD